MSILEGMSTEEKQQFIDEHNRTHLIKFITHTDMMVMDDLLLTFRFTLQCTPNTPPGCFDKLCLPGINFLAAITCLDKRLGD